LSNQPPVTPDIVAFLIGVLSTIQFNYQFLFQANEVNNVWPDWPLSAKLITVDLTKPQVTPKHLFRVGEMTSQLSRSVDRRLQWPPS
jgi:hypothetical protein